jgi:hypothetical protein
MHNKVNAQETTALNEQAVDPLVTTSTHEKKKLNACSFFKQLNKTLEQLHTFKL